MEVRLTPDQEAFIRRVIEAGRFGRAEDAVEEALSIWEKHGAEIDLLLTDMILPDGLTGREVAKQLQARKPALKVIYVSGYSMESDGTTFRLRPGTSFLQKPYQPQKLLQTIRENLDGKQT